MIEIADYIDPSATIVICALTYFIITAFAASLKTWLKQLITLLIGIIVSVVYYFLFDTDLKILITSFSVSIVLYDFVIKHILRKLSIDYNSYNKGAN